MKASIFVLCLSFLFSFQSSAADFKIECREMREVLAQLTLALGETDTAGMNWAYELEQAGHGVDLKPFSAGVMALSAQIDRLAAKVNKTCH